MSENCPKCGEILRWLSGSPAHPDNLYCENCDYRAWEERQPTKTEQKLSQEIAVWTLCMKSQVSRSFTDGTNRFHFLDSGKFVKHSDHQSELKKAQREVLEKAKNIIGKANKDLDFDYCSGPAIKSHIDDILDKLITEIGEGE